METLIYALPQGEVERYKEQLISSRCKTQKDVDKVIAAASADGWHGFRIAKFTPGEKPDFTRSIVG